jgi:hypothetical protein
MPKLKLAKLPDRTPAKITITVSAELSTALSLYADIYRAAYGEAEPVAELIPFMLDSFLDSDRGFATARKNGAPSLAGAPPGRPERQEPTAAPAASTKEA